MRIRFRRERRTLLQAITEQNQAIAAQNELLRKQVAASQAGAKVLDDALTNALRRGLGGGGSVRY